MNNRLTHDEYYLKILNEVKKRSTCKRREVGAIIVDRGYHILSTGYNGVPRNIPHCITLPCKGFDDPPGNTDRCEAVHAEVNAVLQCSRIDYAHTIYVSCTPCFSCTKMLLNTNIQIIITCEPYADERGRNMWLNSGRIIKIW